MNEIRDAVFFEEHYDGDVGELDTFDIHSEVSIK